MSDALVVFMHGVGSSGASLAPLARVWADVLQGVAFAAPDGPFPFDQGGSGRQWFSVAGVTPANRADRIVAARPAFDAVLEDLIAAHGLSVSRNEWRLSAFLRGRSWLWTP